MRVFLMEEQPYILLMDEPEISLHIEWQYKLFEEIRHLNPNCQIITSTHSPSLFGDGWGDKLVFVVMHIPSSLQKKLRYNTLDQDETVNTAALYKLLEGYNAHIISGHTHFNTNVCLND